MQNDVFLADLCVERCLACKYVTRLDFRLRRRLCAKVSVVKTSFKQLKEKKKYKARPPLKVTLHSVKMFTGTEVWLSWCKVRFVTTNV